ncbi:hypothetical protein K0P33_24300 [Pseudomonas sp. ArH3a]|uniref:hypothetical protein n=1 Tax=Pseudomonas TaxID=286 RepID=UPI001F599806|nr:hypothetical protein [Pseudomonas sp. ArH3a]UNM18621.1 hypothetical protein K0P33_24300 [Pseudomonas sp. ArH3a]
MTTDHYLAPRPDSSTAVGDFALGLWKDHWIMSHEAVRGRYCLAPKWPRNARGPVRHCPGCELSHSHYPLRDLAKILADLPAVPA